MQRESASRDSNNSYLPDNATHVAKGGQMDFRGMMAGYSQFFGTKDQPSKPARTTVQVTLPAGDRGGLVEIDVIAVRPK